jgi:cell shape-determining protein MreC
MDFLEVLSFVLVNIILPSAGIFALIYLAVLFHHSAKSVQVITDDIEFKLKAFNRPIEAIINITDTIDSLTKFIKSLKTLKEEKKDENG